jgi:hypothetical protein
MTKPTMAVILLAAIIIGGIRPFLESHPVSATGSYEAISHLFLGGLIGAWLATRQRLYIWIVVALSIVELACFLAKS